MRFYRTPGGSWHGTQADARQACLDEAENAGAYGEIDVPTDKPSLLDWLNRNCGRAAVRAAEAEAELERLHDQRHAAMLAPPPAQPPARSPAGPEGAISLTQAEEFIQAADHRQLCNLTENVILRMRELMPEPRA